jgi:hypothetical protein
MGFMDHILGHFGYHKDMPPGYLTVKQAAERLRLSEQAVRNLCKRGRLEAEKHIAKG